MEVMGPVDNVMILEREAFEIFITQMKGQYTLEKAVKLIIKDYKDQSVDVVKVTTKDKVEILVVSEMLKYE